MEVVIQPDVEQAAYLTALLIAEAIQRKPDAVLGLATGRTMERVYDVLVKMNQKGEVDFSQCRTFNLDEYIGVSPDHPDSYRFYMNRHVFNRTNIQAENTHVLNGAAASLREECRRYEAQIAACGGIDLQLLGIGEDGHIGFNEPLSSLMSRTRDKSLTSETIRQNAVLFGGDESRVPHRALTMGVGTILDARQVVLLATGAGKADILPRAVEGPITSMVTASALQLHADCRIVVDEAAAAKLQGRDYYHWIYCNEPAWRELAVRSHGRLQ